MALGKLPQTVDARRLSSLVIAVIQGMSVLVRDGADVSELLGIAKLALDAWPR